MTTSGSPSQKWKQEQQRVEAIANLARTCREDVIAGLRPLAVLLEQHAQECEHSNPGVAKAERDAALCIAWTWNALGNVDDKLAAMHGRLESMIAGTETVEKGAAAMAKSSRAPTASKSPKRGGRRPVRP